MSKGSKIVPVRIPDQLHSQVIAEVARRKASKQKKIASLGEWVRQAIVEKLAHSRRSNAKTPKVSCVRSADDGVCKHGIEWSQGCEMCDRAYDQSEYITPEIFLP